MPAIALDDFGQHVVQRAEDAAALGVVRMGELLAFLAWQRAQSLGETMVAIHWPSCWKASGSPSCGHVAFVAADVGPVVLAVAPLLVDAGVFRLVAVDAGLGLGGHLGQPPGLGEGRGCAGRTRPTASRRAAIQQVHVRCSERRFMAVLLPR